MATCTWRVYIRVSSSVEEGRSTVCEMDVEDAMGRVRMDNECLSQLGPDLASASEALVYR